MWVKDQEDHIKPSQSDDPLIEQARLLIRRLERLSADSVWAHRASGLRGGLLKSLEALEMPNSAKMPDERRNLEGLIVYGFQLLENAARELIR